LVKIGINIIVLRTTRKLVIPSNPILLTNNL